MPTVAAASARMAPGVESSGALIDMPPTNAGTFPTPSATAAPFSLVLPGMYWVFTGMASRSKVSAAFSVPMFLIVIV